ncbi:hypothetical protein HN51_026551 [Arachis hypogaea]
MEGLSQLRPIEQVEELKAIIKDKCPEQNGDWLVLLLLGLGSFSIVENIRRRKAIRGRYIDNPEAVLDMSAIWLIPHNVLNGIAEAFNAIGQSEFYYTEFPRSMSSIAAGCSLVQLGKCHRKLVSFSNIQHCG